MQPVRSTFHSSPTMGNTTSLSTSKMEIDIKKEDSNKLVLFNEKLEEMAQGISDLNQGQQEIKRDISKILAFLNHSGDKIQREIPDNRTPSQPPVIEFCIVYNHLTRTEAEHLLKFFKEQLDLLKLPNRGKLSSKEEISLNKTANLFFITLFATSSRVEGDQVDCEVLAQCHDFSGGNVIFVNTWRTTKSTAPADISDNEVKQYPSGIKMSDEKSKIPLILQFLFTYEDKLLKPELLQNKKNTEKLKLNMQLFYRILSAAK